MNLTRFSLKSLIQLSAVLSVLLGMIYSQTAVNIFLGLGPELNQGNAFVDTWSTYAIYGGIIAIVGSFFINVFQSPNTRRIFLALALLSMVLLIAAQVPALFWWSFAGMFAHSWSALIVFMLHIVLFVLSSWSGFVALRSIKNELDNSVNNSSRLQGVTLVRASAFMSMVIGILYVPAVLGFTPLVDYLGPKTTEAIDASKVWVTCSVAGGIIILAGSYFKDRGRSNPANRKVLAITLLSMLVIIATQIPQLYRWLDLFFGSYSWPNLVFVILHIGVVALPYWGGMVTIRTLKEPEST